MPPDIGSSGTVVVLLAQLGNLSSTLQRFPSLIFTSRTRSPRGDDNLEKAEVFLRITKEQLDAIHEASQQTSNTYAEEISHIENDLDKMNSWLNTVKKAREGHTTLKQTLRKLGNDAATKDVLQAARKLSKKAERTSARVASESTNSSTASITLQATPSSWYSIIPNNEVPPQADLSGISFSFDGKPTAEDAKKIEDIICLVSPELYIDDDSTEEPGSVRVLRSRKSDLSTYSYHYWGPDAYNTGESGPTSGDTSSQLSSPSRTSTGMQLGDHATFNQCHVTIVNMQSNDSSTVSDATSNIGVDFAVQDTPLLPSTVHRNPRPSCDGSRSLEAIQTNVISREDAAVEDVPEQYIPAASLSQAQSSNPLVSMQAVSQADLGEGAARQASPLTAAGTQNVKSHSLTVSGSAVVFSPTMNFNSPGATGATNVYSGAQPTHSPLPQASPQNRHLDAPGFKCMDFTDNSVVYNPTFNDESQDASSACNQEIPAVRS